MHARNVVIGQKVDPDKVARARDLRRRATRAERMLWQQLRGNKLAGWHFRRQQVIDGYIVDFYCHAAGLVVEVDGPIHAQQREYDASRDSVLSVRGLRILGVANQEVIADLEGVVERIAAACRSADQGRAEAEE